MDSHKSLSPGRQLRWKVLLFLAILLISVTAAHGAPQKAIVLPFNIHAPGDTNTLTANTDKELSQSLAEGGIQLLDRLQAGTMADYQGAWPPPVDTLKAIASDTGTEFVAAGNLTVIGDSLLVDFKLFDLLAPDTPTYYSRTASNREQWKSAIQAVAQELLAYLNRDFRVDTISPEGNKKIDSGAILRKIRTKPGDPYDPAALRADLKEIYGMGYFNDVQIDVRDTTRGKAVIFRVVEKPIIKSVIYEGIDELKEDDVKSAANLKENFVLNPAKIGQAKEAILQLYKSKGFYNSQVDPEISYPDDKGAVVRIKIDEGKKIYIKEITVEGNVTFDDDEILDEIETGEKWLLSWITESGLLDMNKIRQDAQRIVAFYHNHGFLEAKVAEPAISQEEEWLFVKFIVEEGVRFRVGTVSLSGDLIADDETLLNLLTVRKENYLSRQTLRDDILKLTDYYAEAGYAFANIRPMTKKAPEGDRIDVNLQIDKGSLVYIDRVTIKGNTRTRDNVIRRELKVAEGGIFNSKALRDSTQNLQRLQYFEEVNISPEPSLDPNRMNIIVDVKEKSTGNFSIGAGYSSADKLILTGQISENNFLGRGDTMALSANVSGVSSRYNLSYTNPHLNDSALSWGFDAFSAEREYDDYTRDSKGGGLRIGYPIIEQWRLYGNYSYTDTDLTDVSEDASYVIRNSVDLHVTSALEFSLVRDTRNRRYGASEGSRNQVSVQYAGGPLGGDAQFTKVEGSTSWFFPMPFSTVFHIKGAAGQIFENEDDKLPVYERFYLGGLNSIRGFKYAKVSPIDPDTGERIGGDKMWYTNTEVIFPLLETQGVMGVIFFDAGRVYNDDEDWDELNDELKKATGLGVRWLSPMGPLRIVWGYNLDPQPDEDDSVWDFSVGGVF